MITFISPPLGVAVGLGLAIDPFPAFTFKAAMLSGFRKVDPDSAADRAAG